MSFVTLQDAVLNSRLDWLRTCRLRPSFKLPKGKKMTDLRKDDRDLIERLVPRDPMTPDEIARDFPDITAPEWCVGPSGLESWHYGGKPCLVFTPVELDAGRSAELIRASVLQYGPWAWKERLAAREPHIRRLKLSGHPVIASLRATVAGADDSVRRMDAAILKRLQPGA